MARRMSIIFDGFEKIAAELDRQGKELKPAVNEALEETQKYIQQELQSAAQPYANGGHKGYAKGDMYDAIITDADIDWKGSVASVKVGFSTLYGGWEGFMHSIFVMYGVPAHGKFNRGYGKDAKVYNAIRGIRTKKQIEKLQKEVMEKYLKGR